jgi:transcriptional regulator with AAA-type ATPase domain
VAAGPDTEVDGTVKVSSSSAFSFSEYRFVVDVGPDQGREEVGSEPAFDIGTDRGCSLKLTDETVSRHHCSLRVGPDGFVIRDHDSTNGTWINGTRIIQAFLHHNDTIKLGMTTLRFKTESRSVEKPVSRIPVFAGIFGQSKAMRRIFDLMPRLAESQSTVLVTGETGTGKSLVAKTLHRQGTRRAGPLIALDCSAIPPTLIESELFGHEKGAFTGAVDARAGAFEAADGGTLFLDEVGELPIELQAKFLASQTWAPSPRTMWLGDRIGY